MSWYTEYFTPDRRGEVELAYPYISALLLTPEEHADVVEQRIHNFIRARNAEHSQPTSVNHLPYHLVLDPVSYCNLSCPLCVQATDPHGRTASRISRSSFQSLLEELQSALIRIDLFNWGEPLLHPEFCELVAAAASCGAYTRTSTNLSHKHRFDAKQIVSSGLQYLVVSIDGATGPTYSKYRRGGDFDLVLRNLRELVEAREAMGVRTPLIDWQFLVFNYNEHEIAEARKVAMDIGVDVFRYGGARGMMASKLDAPTDKNVRDSSDHLLPGNHELSEYNENDDKRWTSERSTCRWLWSHAAVHANGGVAPCWSTWFESLDYGNISDGGMRATWNNPRFLAARQTVQEGGDINGSQVCHRCAYHRNYVNTPDSPEDELNPDIVSYVADRLGESGRRPAPGILTVLSKHNWAKTGHSGATH